MIWLIAPLRQIFFDSTIPSLYWGLDLWHDSVLWVQSSILVLRPFLTFPFHMSSGVSSFRFKRPGPQTVCLHFPAHVSLVVCWGLIYSSPSQKLLSIFHLYPSFIDNPSLSPNHHIVIEHPRKPTRATLCLYNIHPIQLSRGFSVYS